jgi:hypothetical protein
MIDRPLAGAFLAAALGACAAATPPTAPAQAERRAVVVPAPPGARAGGGTTPSAPACGASCPAPRPGEVLAGCHDADPDRRLGGLRAARADPATDWIVCYFDPR